LSGQRLYKRNQQKKGMKNISIFPGLEKKERDYPQGEREVEERSEGIGGALIGPKNGGCHALALVLWEGV